MSPPGLELADVLWLPLQTADPDWLQPFKDGNFFKGMVQPLVERLSRAGILLVVGVPYTFALWQQTESVVPPAIVLTLFMGLFLSGAPPGARFVGYLAVVVATTVAYYSIFSGRG